MSKYYSYLNTTKAILDQYRGNEPLASFLKQFFALEKKFGAKDRKQITHLCYCYFRLGKMKSDLPVEERILLGLFLCSEGTSELLLQFNSEWDALATRPINEKLLLSDSEKVFEKIFPFDNEISDDIDKKVFVLSHITQPDVFLRLRPGKEAIVKNKIQDAGMTFRIISDNCIALPGASKIDSFIALNTEAVVQDYSSQKVAEFLILVRPGQPAPIFRGSDRVWDCCAGSGGKSIMLFDLYPAIDLTVSDIRESILINLKKRFREAGISNYKSFVANLTTSPSDRVIRAGNLPVRPSHPGGQRPTSPSDRVIRAGNFQLILADVPCSGSGTWGRTPEQLYYYQSEKTNEYSQLQKKIVSNIIPHLKGGGYLLYVTCSVFKQENEEVVSFITENFPLELIKMEVLKGYDKKADTMFAALLQNKL